MKVLKPFVLALCCCATTAPWAEALNASRRLVDYSLKSWLEGEAPFPFGVYAIAQDRDGYSILGTRLGLVRFDGTTFYLWKDASELLDNRISQVITAADGTLWVGYGTVSGITRITDGKVTNFSVPDGLTSGTVTGLLQDRDGAIWASTYAGVSRFERGRWTAFDADEGLPPVPITSVFKDSRDALFVSTSRGVYRMAPSESRFTFIAPWLGGDFVEDQAGTVWTADPNHGLRPVEGASSSSSSPFEWRGALGRVLMNERGGGLWVGTRGHGVIRAQGLGGAPGAVVIDRLTRADGLPTNEIRSLFEDREGTIWIGTRLGLSRLSDRNIKAALAPPVHDTFVEAVIATADGSVWTGTANGLHRKFGGQEQTYGVEQGLPGPIVSALHEDAEGTLWAATNEGLARLSNGRFVAVGGPPGLELRNVQSMTTDRDGALWLCDLQVFKWHHGRMTQIDVGPREGRPYVGYTDRAGRVWIGFWIGGIARFDGDEMTLYSTEHGLPSGTINVVYEDGGGTIWIGTSEGLVRFDGQRFQTVSKSGFQSAVVSIIEDEFGHLWFGLASGLLRIARRELSKQESDTALAYSTYGTEDGLPGTLGRPGTPSAARTPDGNLWFLTSQGLAVVDPRNLAASRGPGPLRIDEFVADGRWYGTESGQRVGPNLSRIQIGYATLNLAAAPKGRFRYKLENFETEWQDAGDRRQASYTNLPPGDYRFTVVSNNAEGGWNEHGAEISFVIVPAFYQTKPFYAASVGVLALGLWSAWRLRVRRLRTQFNLVLAERTRMGREIHDTLLQSLVGVALEFDDISEQLDPSASALSMQVRRIRQQVEHYIREARQSIWNLRSPSLRSCDLATALQHFGEAATHGHHSRFQVAVTGPARPALPRVDEQLLRIGQEAISNAVRHSGAGAILLDLHYEEHHVTLTVRDNGCGFDPEQVHRSADGHWGVTSMRERAQQIGGECRLDSALGAGTTIEVRVSLSSNTREVAESNDPYPLRRRSSAGT